MAKILVFYVIFPSSPNVTLYFFSRAKKAVKEMLFLKVLESHEFLKYHEFGELLRVGCTFHIKMQMAGFVAKMEFFKCITFLVTKISLQGTQFGTHSLIYLSHFGTDKFLGITFRNLALLI